MRSIFAALIIFLTVAFAFGQNEQAPILEKEIAYKDWTYKTVQTGESINLRDYTRGKKLVMVVYFAPWCGNWKFDAPMLQRFHDKYKAQGLGIIAVGEYDPVTAMKANLDALKITFPAVYESESRSDKQKTLHYGYRRTTGDARGWGSPWYVFLMPSLIEGEGDILTKKTFVINGEVVEAEGEAFIRKHLGLPPGDVKTGASTKEKIEICDPATVPAALKKP